MTASRPTVLFALADRSWLRWLPPLLEHEAYSHCIQCLPESPRPDQVDLAGGTALAVLLSDHETLLDYTRLAGGLAAAARIPVIHPPETIVRLGCDKRAMASVAAGVSGCSPIGELTPAGALLHLAAAPGSSVVLKFRNDTQGRRQRVFASAGELDAGLAQAGPAGAFLLQPFVQGMEYSVNVISNGREGLAFEPVGKGPTSLRGIHPCKRLRFCPCPRLSAADRSRLIETASRYARAAGVVGLCEIEFILAGGRLFLVEINPRLSATMRMSSAASGRSLFAELPLSLLDPQWPRPLPQPVCHAAELPFPPGADPGVLQGLDLPLSVSSRVTTTAADPEALRRNLQRIAGRLGLVLDRDALSIANP